MASLENLKRQITTIEELGGIVSALEQMAALSLLQTRSRLLTSRPFMEELWKVYRILRQLTPLAPSVKNRDLTILVTLNQGMAGGLLNKVIATGEQLFKEHGGDLLITGKKGQSHFSKQRDVTIHFFNLPNTVKFEEIQPLKDVLGQYQRVHIVYPKYESTYTQTVDIVSLVAEGGKDVTATKENLLKAKQFYLEPNPQDLVTYFNQTLVGMIVYNLFNEAQLAYSAAQMVAMRNAHDSAEDELKQLTFRYNKQRRSLIDTKLRELQKVKGMLGTQRLTS